MGAAKRWSLMKTSLAYHYELFFELSTLHGVRYIKENGRPSYERVLWFCCTTVSAVAALIIITSLWEKFQTNPTITGLDPDFHSFDVPFPAVALCPSHPFNLKGLKAYVDEKYGGDEFYFNFFISYLTYSMYSLVELGNIGEEKKLPTESELKDVENNFSFKCSDLITGCVLLDEEQPNCCDIFTTLRTEVGMCFIYNSRLAAHLAKKSKGFKIQFISEADDRWAINITVDSKKLVVVEKRAPNVNIYLLSNDEIPTYDMEPHHRWSRQVFKMKFSVQHTYTTESARALSISQRRCYFSEEYKLHSDSVYTLSACASQCRMSLINRLCQCVPTFFEKRSKQKYCTQKNMKCIAKYNLTILGELGDTCDCELGCDNTVYTLETLDSKKKAGRTIDLSFVSWPLIRFKRDVLFGWDDLLVSLGGIAGLFLGCSLLSGVEILYYLTLRAWCMVAYNEGELESIRNERLNRRRPPLDLSLTPYCMRDKKVVMKGTGMPRVHVRRIPTVASLVPMVQPPMLELKRRTTLRPPGIFNEVI